MYPTNECIFNIKLELKHEAGHNLKIKYDWMKLETTLEGKQNLIFAENDSGILKDWNLLCIEGEPPIQM
jgi:hypothetical protein